MYARNSLAPHPLVDTLAAAVTGRGGGVKAHTHPTLLNLSPPPQLQAAENY